jgi:pimeloyl-ACP methyl ester carboxylesterase
VHVIDRRGPGASGPLGSSYSIDSECDDLEAVLVATGATHVFGHSYGGGGRPRRNLGHRAMGRPGRRRALVASDEARANVNRVMQLLARAPELIELEPAGGLLRAPSS